MAQNRGEIFEDQFKSSVPRGVEVRKLATAGPRAQSLAQVSEMLTRLARKAGEEVPGWARGLLSNAAYAPKQPYDFILMAPAAGASMLGGDLRDHQGAPMRLAARPCLNFCLELKSAGGDKSLRFDRLKEHQEKGLLKAATQGHVAGVVIEFPDVGVDGEVYFLPIGPYMAHKRECGRQSLALDAARAFGLLIAVDQGRGVKHRYWQVGRFLAHFGADVQS